MIYRKDYENLKKDKNRYMNLYIKTMQLLARLQKRYDKLEELYERHFAENVVEEQNIMV